MHTMTLMNDYVAPLTSLLGLFQLLRQVRVSLSVSIHQDYTLNSGGQRNMTHVNDLLGQALKIVRADEIGSTMTCRACGVAFDPVADLPFVRLGRGSYCSINCIRSAMAERGAEQELVLAAEGPVKSRAEKMRRRLRQAFAEGHPHVCTVCCDLKALHDAATTAQGKEAGSFYDVVQAAEAHYSLLARFLGADVCSLACALTHLAKLPDFSYKGYWLNHADRCAQCGTVNRYDCDGSFADLLLVDGQATFCSSACLLAFLQGPGRGRVRRIPWAEAIHMVEYAEGCLKCQVGVKDDDDATPFIVMRSGYGPPVDGGALFCSVECIIALFGHETWHAWDAKGAHRPRPDGLGHQQTL